VAATRDVLIDAALACDFEQLAALAWVDVPLNESGWGTFWGEATLTSETLRRLDRTQNALWDLAVALIYTQPVWEFSECEDGGTGWYCGLEWYIWPRSRGFTPSSLTSGQGWVPDQLQRLALLDGTTLAEFGDRLLAGYSTFSVLISISGQWMAAYPPAPGECPTEQGSPIDVTDEPDWRRLFPWTDTLGCPVRVDVLYERTGPDHCGWQDTRVLVTGDPLGTRFQPFTNDVEYVRDPDGLYSDRGFVEGFARLDSLPPDAVDTGFRLRDRELWTSPSDPDAIYINSANGVERWPRGEPPICA
jgi:hypothetical protein